MDRRQFVLQPEEPIIRWVHPYEHSERMVEFGETLYGRTMDISEVGVLLHASPFVAIPMPRLLGAEGRALAEPGALWHPLWWIPEDVSRPQMVGSETEPLDMRMVRMVIELCEAGWLDPVSAEWANLEHLALASEDEVRAFASNAFGGEERRSAAVENAFLAFAQVEADGFAEGPKAFLEILDDLKRSEKPMSNIGKFVALAARWFAADEVERTYWDGVVQAVGSGGADPELLYEIEAHLAAVDAQWTEVFAEPEPHESVGVA